MDLFKLGKDKKTGRILEISEVESGLGCNCACPNCGKDLIAVQGENTEWHFRHQERTDCKKGPEMGILALAEEILTSNSHIKLPKFGRVEYERAEASQKDIYFLPEVTVFTDDTEFYIDIVLDKNDSSRAKSYLEGQHNSIEIDLSEYVYTSKKEFKKALLDTKSNKRIIYWNDESKKSSKSAPLALALLGTGVVLGALALSGKKKKKKLSFTLEDMWENPKDYYQYGKNKWASAQKKSEKQLSESKKNLEKKISDSKRKLERELDETKRKLEKDWEKSKRKIQAQIDKPKQLWESEKDKPQEFWESTKSLLDKPAEILEEGQDYLKKVGDKIKDKMGFL